MEMLERARGLTELRMQRDYLEAYCCVTRGSANRALEIAACYADLEHPTWHAMFAAVTAHVMEAQGIDDDEEELVDGDADRARTVAMERMAKSEPLLDLAVEGNDMLLETENLSGGECCINFYRMDLELLFSTNPFMEGASAQSAQFAFLQPNHTIQVDTSRKDRTSSIDLTTTGSYTVPIPDEFVSSNVMIEAVGGGKRSSQPYFSHTMRCDMLQNVGQVKVADAATGGPLASVYVKVYSKSLSSSPAFYKDGYTDLRGRFDYFSLSTSQPADKFAILIPSKGNGALVKQAFPPARGLRGGGVHSFGCVGPIGAHKAC